MTVRQLIATLEKYDEAGLPVLVAFDPDEPYLSPLEISIRDDLCLCHDDAFTRLMRACVIRVYEKSPKGQGAQTEG